MAATILGAAKLLSTVIALVDVGIDGYDTLSKVTGVIKDRQAQGKPITQGDMWSAVGDDDAGKAILEEAIRKG